VKHGGAEENNVDGKLIDEYKRQGATLRAQDGGWIRVETPNVNADNDLEKC
jgi:hypothetical protein